MCLTIIASLENEVSRLHRLMVIAASNDSMPRIERLALAKHYEELLGEAARDLAEERARHHLDVVMDNVPTLLQVMAEGAA